ncbi:hypothetical protein BASA81_004901 [Batrachochytrium salamandrivorans]|nr:hypothetical protein BASA81_004901 [Batrachochytrium salamandrivorans]
MSEVLSQYFLQGVMFGQLEVCKALVGRVNLETRDGNDNTALHIASLSGQVDMVSLLLQCGVQVNAFDSELDTALHCAAMNGHLEVCKELVRFGADVFARNALDQSPQDYAQQNRERVVERYLRKEALKQVLVVLRSAQEVKRISKHSPIAALPKDLCRLLQGFLC